jgi:hypothetical protein
VFDDAGYTIGNGKAILVLNATITINSIEFTGASVADNNGAGLRVQAGNLTVNNSTFTNNQEGILGAASQGITIAVSNSSFTYNGACDGFSHGLYDSGSAGLTLTGNTFANTCVGNDVQSRAAMTTVTGNAFDECDPASSASYELNIANGGVGDVAGNSFCKGPNAENPAFISYDPGGYLYPDNSLTVSGNTFVGPATLLQVDGPTIAVENFSDQFNPDAPVTAQITGNTITCVDVLAAGSADASDNAVNPCPVPEPGSIMLLGPLVLLGLVVRAGLAHFAAVKAEDFSNSGSP